MACDESVAARVRERLSGVPGIGEIRMFGGVCFTLNGNMLCGVVKDELVVRVGADAYPAALLQPHARVMDFAHRPMRGYVYVGAAGFQSTANLQAWLDAARDFVGKLPPKKPKKAPTPPARGAR